MSNMAVTTNLGAMVALQNLSGMANSSASAAMDAAKSRVQSAQDRVSKYASAVSVDFSAGAQAQFASLTASRGTSMGAMVDADLAAESARLQSLQTRQQLGIQSLSIANQAPQALLSLFRG